MRHSWWCIISWLSNLLGDWKMKIEEKRTFNFKIYITMRGEPLAIFFSKTLLLDLQFNGGIPRSRKGLLFIKIAFEIWRNWKKWKIVVFLVNIADGPFYVWRKVTYYMRFQRSRPIHTDVVISRLLETFLTVAAYSHLVFFLIFFFWFSFWFFILDPRPLGRFGVL